MITARCHPLLDPLLPRPQPARAGLPGWLRDMPSEAPAPALQDAPVRTLKHCPPFLDAMSLGLLLPLATDLTVENGEVAWDWDMPALPDTLIPRAPVGLHLPQQATGAPFRVAASTILKFMNFWTLEVPEGWSLLFTHPLNREDLPFRTLSGVVDCDRFGDGYVHIPALWTDAAFTGTLPRGTPVAQIIPLPRALPGLQVETMTPEAIARNRDLPQELHETRGVYRKSHRH